MMMFALIFSIVALIISLVTVPFTVWAFIELMAFKKSTHKVEFIPAPTPSGADMKSIMEGLDQDTFIGNNL